MYTFEEQFVEVRPGIQLCYEAFGDPADPPLLMIAGLGQQLLGCPAELCEMLAARGLRVIRFDNRDAGRSWHASTPRPSLGRLVARRFHPGQYALEDMAGDVARLIDALELPPAHLVGASMGGMIAQTLAIGHPEHVASLTSIVSSTGSRRVGWTAPSTLRLIFSEAPRSPEEAAERAVRMWRHIGSHGFQLDEAGIRSTARAAFARDPRGPAGTGRQLAAILRSGDRTRLLGTIRVPTTVIHGDRDLMVHPSGGRATAAAIPGARLHTIAGMGHDLPRGAWPRLTELIAGTAGAAPARGTQELLAGI